MSWRARIGVIYPADGLLDDELWQLVPDGVTPYITREETPPSGDADLEYVTKIAESRGIEDAARCLRAVKPDVTAFVCTAGSFIKGMGGDLEIARRIEEAGGAPATTTSTALIRALRGLGAGTVAVATPYIDQINDRLAGFLEGNGLKVANLEGMQCRHPEEIGTASPGEVYRFARRADRPEADILFISCTGLPTFGILEPLEEDLGKTVISANQVTMWDALSIAGVRGWVPGAGSLYELL
jgi:maleate isomerase